jgi:hypothetical protein
MVGIIIIPVDLEGACVFLRSAIGIAAYIHQAVGQYQIDDQYTQDIDYVMMNERKFGYNSRPSFTSRP